MSNIFFSMCPMGWSGGGLRRWLSLALVIIGLGVWGSAQAQYTTINPINLSSSVTDYGGNQTYDIPLAATSPGTRWDVTYTLTNNTGYPLRFIKNLTNPGVDITFTISGLTLVSATVPVDLTVPPGGSFTVTFQAGVPTTGVATTTTITASFFYSVGRVWDQVWVDDDFDSFCGYLYTNSVANLPLSALGSMAEDGDGTGAQPGCVYSQDAQIVNDMDVPVTVSYAGYTDDGTLAPYVSGELCNSSIPRFCGPSVPGAQPPYWPGEITLAPGELSPVFRMIVGMPWYIGNESTQATGDFAFTWNVTRVSAPPPAHAVPTPVPTLNMWALAWLALGLAGVGGWRIRRGGRP